MTSRWHVWGVRVASMIDPCGLFAPLLVLGVVALLGFVGCSLVFPLEERPVATAANVRAIPGDGLVVLFWDPADDARSYTVYPSDLSGVPRDPITDVLATTYTDPMLINGNPYAYAVSTVMGVLESDPSGLV